MSKKQIAVSKIDFDEMGLIHIQHAKTEVDMTCSDVRELEEARARIVELELERDNLESRLDETLALAIQMADEYDEVVHYEFGSGSGDIQHTNLDIINSLIEKNDK